MAALAALAGDPNYICRCQSVVNNPESPPRPTSSHPLPLLLLCVQNISCFLSNRPDVGAVHGMRLAVQGEASSGSYFRRGLRVRATLLPRYNQPPLTAATYHLPTDHLQATRAEAPWSSYLCRNLQYFYPQRLLKSLSFICGLAIFTRNSISI